MTLPPLRQAIDAFRANDIATVLRTAGVSDVPKTKDGKTELLTKLMGDPARISTALGRLNTRCRKALQILQQADGEMRSSRYRSLLQRAGVLRAETNQPRVSRYDYYRSQPENTSDPGTYEEILAALLKYGLVWTHTLQAYESGNAKLGFEGGRYVYIPEEVVRHLPAVPEPETRKLQVSQVVSGSARTCQRDLYLMWSAAREAPFQITNAGLLRVSDLKRIVPQLLVSETFSAGNKEGDFRRVFFLRRLLMALSLLSTAPGENALVATPDAPFWQTEATQRVQACFQSWRDGAWWNELWATYEQGSTRASGSLSDFAPAQVVKARRFVLETLTQSARTNDEWISVDSLIDHLHNRDEEFLIDRETAERMYGSYYYSSYAHQTSSPYLYNGLGWAWDRYQRDPESGWDGVEAVFISSVLTEGLYWLGLLDLGYARAVTPAGGMAPTGVQAVRLTDMGRWLLLDGARPVIPDETGRVVVQPNFHVFAFDPISDAVLARLDSFATRLKAERAVEYEITRDSIYRAQQDGQRVEDISAWLVETTGMPLPQNIARSLEEWQAAFERIVIRQRVGWLQTATPELADALLSDARLRHVILKRAGPTSLLLNADGVDDVERALLTAGELPVRTTHPDDAHKASIKVAPDGVITFAHAVPSLYVFGNLHPVADQIAGGWRITAESVNRARERGWDAKAIISNLEGLALGSVPAELQARIKAWSKYYGDAIIQTLTIVQFRDQDILNELRASPALARYLKPFKPEARLGLAVVKAGDIATVQALLTELGVEVTIE